MKDWERGMVLEWALLSQTQAQMNRDIFENIQQANRIPRLNTQICNTINTLDSRNWGTASSVNAASYVFIHEAPEFQKVARIIANLPEKKEVKEDDFHFQNPCEWL